MKMAKGAIRSQSKTKGGALRALIGADLLTLAAMMPAQVQALTDLAVKIKAKPTKFEKVLKGRSCILLFEKPSLRTRLSFEVGINKLGGQCIYMDHSQQRLGQRESVHDYAKNLERWIDCIIPRVFDHQTLVKMAAASKVPVINALCDKHHPCQALADVLTLREHFGKVEGLKVVYVGDGNNVCHSLMHACVMSGAHMMAITPKGFEPAPEYVQECAQFAKETGGSIAVSNDLKSATDADAIYTDVWASMGTSQDEAGRRMKQFGKYQVNATLMAAAAKRAVFMHCLPAHRGVEVTDEVLDGSQSVVYDQAENRMWAQMALLTCLFKNA